MIFSSFVESYQFFLLATFIIALVLGVVVNKTNFCTMGAVSDMVNMSDYTRMRAWLLAISVAILGVVTLEASGLADPDSAFPPYRASQFIWLENLLGGFLFGIGMTLASGCGNKTLIRIGGGNLKSIVVFAIIAVIAFYMANPLPGGDSTLFSLLFYDWIRPTAIDLSHNADLGSLVAEDNSVTARLIIGLVLALTLLIFILKSADFRRSGDAWLSGIVVGAAVVLAWFVTSNVQIDVEEELYSLSGYYEEWDMLADDEEGKPAVGRVLSPQSFTFINPIGQSYGYVASGFDSSIVSFGLVAVAGVILGSLLWALISKSFRLEWFVNGKDFLTHVIGAILMGFGGVLALGCTIGQAITGVSTLALGSFISFFAILLGSALTMKMQYYKMLYEDASWFAVLLTALVELRLLPPALRKLERL